MGRFWSAVLWSLMAVIIRTSFAWDVTRRSLSFRRGISLTSARQQHADVTTDASLRQPSQRPGRARCSTRLLMALRNRGLEVRKETATPTGEKGGSCARFQFDR